MHNKRMPSDAAEPRRLCGLASGRSALELLQQGLPFHRSRRQHHPYQCALHPGGARLDQNRDASTGVKRKK